MAEVGAVEGRARGGGGAQGKSRKTSWDAIVAIQAKDSEGWRHNGNSKVVRLCVCVCVFWICLEKKPIGIAEVL